MFTSSQSVSEFALAASEGWTPLGIVTGCFVGPVELEPEMPEASRELAAVTRHYQRGFQTAVDRLRQNAAKKKASGVVGVRLTAQMRAQEVCEWTAYGTALASAEAHHGPPFVSTLSGQEMSVLRQAGYRPVCTVYGTCVYYQKPHVAVQQKLRTGFLGSPVSQPNVERKDYTRAVYKARQNAFARMEAAAAGLGADGVLGITITTQVRLLTGQHHGGGFMVHLTALGTAVAEDDPSPASRNSSLPALMVQGAVSLL